MSQATKSEDMLDSDDLSEVDDRLVDYLSEGRITPSYARSRLEEDDIGEYSRGYIQQQLTRLMEHGHVSKVHKGLYELKYDPRDDIE